MWELKKDGAGTYAVIKCGECDHMILLEPKRKLSDSRDIRRGKLTIYHETAGGARISELCELWRQNIEIPKNIEEFLIFTSKLTDL